jgi:hypothetical protein
VEFCRDNTHHLKVLEINDTSLSGKDSSISVSPQDAPQDSSVILALNCLMIRGVTFDLTVASKFRNLIAQVTYKALKRRNYCCWW